MEFPGIDNSELPGTIINLNLNSHKENIIKFGPAV